MLIPGISGSFASSAAAGEWGDRLQQWADDAVGENTVEVYCDGLDWYVKGPSKQVEQTVVDSVVQRLSLTKGIGVMPT